MSNYNRLIGVVVALWFDDVVTDEQCFLILRLLKIIDKEYEDHA